MAKITPLKIQSLEFQNIGFQFDDKTNILENVNFKFPMNKVVRVRSESGAGRSTLMQVICGILVPSEGKYIINGVDVMTMSFEEFLPYRLSFGYGFDFGGLINNRTIVENLTLPLIYHKLLPVSEANDRACAYLDRLGLLQHKDKRPAYVQGAIRKLVCLLRSIILHPEVLVLDEPSSGLNLDVVQKFFDLVIELRSLGKIPHLYMSTRNKEVMSRFEHTSIYLENGVLKTEPPIMKTGAA